MEQVPGFVVSLTCTPCPLWSDSDQVTATSKKICTAFHLQEEIGDQITQATYLVNT